MKNDDEIVGLETATERGDRLAGRITAMKWNYSASMEPNFWSIIDQSGKVIALRVTSEKSAKEICEWHNNLVVADASDWTVMVHPNHPCSGIDLYICRTVDIEQAKGQGYISFWEFIERRAPQPGAALRVAAKHTLELLDILRQDEGVGNLLTPGVKQLYQTVSESLRHALSAPATDAPVSGWRLLDAGEIIQSGDQWQKNDDQWIPCYDSVGKTLSDFPMAPVRRRIVSPPTPAQRAVVEAAIEWGRIPPHGQTGAALEKLQAAVDVLTTQAGGER